MPSAGRRAGRASGSQESHGPSARRRRPAAPMRSTGRRASPCARRAAPAPPKARPCAHRRRRAPSRRSRARGCARAPSWWAAPTRAGGLVRDAIPGPRASSFGYRFLSGPCDPSRRTPGSKIRCLLSAYRKFAVTRRSTDPRRRARPSPAARRRSGCNGRRDSWKRRSDEGSCGRCDGIRGGQPGPGAAARGRRGPHADATRGSSPDAGRTAR